MTNKIEISRELLIRCARIALDAGYVQLHHTLTDLLAAPAVERQEPAAPRHNMKSVMSAVCLVPGLTMLTSDKCHALARALNSVTSPPAPVAVRITLQQVLKAYDYAESHPHKYLRGTTNWCAAVAHELNACLDKVKELNQ